MSSRLLSNKEKRITRYLFYTCDVIHHYCLKFYSVLKLPILLYIDSYHRGANGPEYLGML